MPRKKAVQNGNGHGTVTDAEKLADEFTRVAKKFIEGGMKDEVAVRVAAHLVLPPQLMEKV
jgi:hypothetical protein